MRKVGDPAQGATLFEYYWDAPPREGGPSHSNTGFLFETGVFSRREKDREEKGGGGAAKQSEIQIRGRERSDFCRWEEEPLASSGRVRTGILMTSRFPPPQTSLVFRRSSWGTVKAGFISEFPGGGLFSRAVSCCPLYDRPIFDVVLWYDIIIT